MLESSTPPLGQWPSAPLAFVVAELQFERLGDLDRKLVEAQGRLSESYPLYDVTGIETLTATPTGGQMVRSSEPAHDFRNIENTTGVRITSNSIQLHTVVYSNYDDFSTKWTHALNVSAEVLRPRVLARAGLRYVDLIVPEAEDESPNGYLAPALAQSAISLEGVGELEQHAVILAYQDGRVVSRASLLNLVKVGLALPPSFVPMPLAFSAMQSKALERQRAGKPVGFLDFDVASHGPQLLENGKLADLYDDLHRRHSALFAAAISDHARTQWKRKPS